MNVSEVGPAQETVRGFLLHVFHRNRGAKTILYGVGRLETGETFALAESRRQPTFFVRSSEADDVRAVSLRSGADLTPSQLTTMDGEPVERVAVPHLGTLYILGTIRKKHTPYNGSQAPYASIKGRDRSVAMRPSLY